MTGSRGGGVGLTVLAVGAVLLSACSAAPVTPGTATTPVAVSSSRAEAPVSEASPAATESNPPGDIPDNQAFVTYQVPNKKVSVKVPEGWARTVNASGTTFTDKLNTISIVAGTAATPPTVDSVTAEISGSAPRVPKFAMGKVTVVTRSGQRVILATDQGDSTPDPVTGKVIRDAFERYTYTTGGRRLDLTLSGPQNADNVDPWKIVSDSVVWS